MGTRFYQKSGLGVKKVIYEILDFGGVMAVCDGSGYRGGWGTQLVWVLGTTWTLNAPRSKIFHLKILNPKFGGSGRPRQ